MLFSDVYEGFISIHATKVLRIGAYAAFLCSPTASIIAINGKWRATVRVKHHGRQLIQRTKSFDNKHQGSEWAITQACPPLKPLPTGSIPLKSGLLALQ